MRTQVSDAANWPAELGTGARAAWGELRANAPELCALAAELGLTDALRAAVAVSQFVHGVMLRQSEALTEAMLGGRLSAPDEPVLDAINPTWDLAQLGDFLRLQRDREMCLIAWHDLRGSRTTTQTLEALSTLAHNAIALACEQLMQRRDDALPPPLIIGMGKLGGGELNFSSDIDLVFVHPDGGDAQRYLKLAREMIALLDQRTAFGLVYRVDVRLRPFGRTGALSLSLRAFESYLQTHARDWERYAYLKARVLTGREQDQQELQSLLRGFVYRRYLDFGVLESLRRTKSLIEADVVRNDSGDDIKRGAGGIREIEFIAQSLQVLRGGRQRALQTTSLIEALAQLEALGWLESDDRAALNAAYDFLRHVENRLQMRRDQQTHTLPADVDELAILCAAMGFADADGFAAALRAHRERVQRIFTALLRPEEAEADVPDAAAELWATAQKDDQSDVSPGAGGEAALRAALQDLASSRPLSRLDAQSRERLDRLVPELLDLAMRQPSPSVVLTRVARVLEGVGRRSAYFSLLNEHRQARERLVALCAASQRVASDVAAYPLLLDSLIDLDVRNLPTHDVRQSQLVAALHGIDPSDLELMTDALAQFKCAAEFEVAVADLTSQLPVMKVSDQLTAIAQSVIDEVLDAAWGDINARYGRLKSTGVAFCVVAYGKLGGLELGYGSDLDLVFLYDTDDDSAASNGPRALVPPVYFARLVQRFVHLATATTRAGKLYDVDMRLRPSGNSGPLVTRLAAYENYLSKNAWTWEHQALLRSRPVAGDAGLAERFGHIRNATLCRSRDVATLRGDVTAMRARMAQANPPKAGTFHVKHDAGGLTDVEFLVQYFLLVHAERVPELVAYSDHMRQLDALIAAGCLGPNVGEDLQAIYLTYREHIHRRTLDDANVRQDAGAMDAERERVRAIWSDVFGAA